jgi:excisionase family DNA binding protein
MTEPIKPEFMSLTDASVFLSISRRTLEKWVANGKIAATRLGRAVRIPMSEIERLVNASAMPKGK